MLYFVAKIKIYFNLQPLQCSKDILDCGVIPVYTLHTYISTMSMLIYFWLCVADDSTLKLTGNLRARVRHSRLELAQDTNLLPYLPYHSFLIIIPNQGDCNTTFESRIGANLNLVGLESLVQGSKVRGN